MGRSVFLRHRYWSLWYCRLWGHLFNFINHSLRSTGLAWMFSNMFSNVVKSVACGQAFTTLIKGDFLWMYNDHMALETLFSGEIIMHTIYLMGTSLLDVQQSIRVSHSDDNSQITICSVLWKARSDNLQYPQYCTIFFTQLNNACEWKIMCCHLMLNSTATGWHKKEVPILFFFFFNFSHTAYKHFGYSWKNLKKKKNPLLTVDIM